MYIMEIAGGSDLAACLQAFSTRYPVTVICRLTDYELERQYPNFRFVYLDGSVPEKRYYALLESQADTLLIFEDTTRPIDRVAETLLEFSDWLDTAGMVGPLYLSGGLSSEEKALALLEYSFVCFSNTEHSKQEARARSGKKANRMPGNILCYKKNRVYRVIPDQDTGIYEGRIDNHLEEVGEIIRFNDGFQFEYAGGDKDGTRLISRFLHGRLYAGQLKSSLSKGQLFLRILRSPFLPLVFFVRVEKDLARNHYGPVSIPVKAWIFIFSIAWSAGEMVGYIFGQGKSLEAWR